MSCALCIHSQQTKSSTVLSQADIQLSIGSSTHPHKSSTSLRSKKKKKNTSRQTHVTDCTESILSAGPLSSVTGWFSNIYFVIFSVSIPMKCNRTVDVAYHVSTPHLVCSSSVIFCFYIAISFGHEPQCQRVVHQARPESESFCAYPNAISRATTVMKSFVLIST